MNAERFSIPLSTRCRARRLATFAVAATAALLVPVLVAAQERTYEWEWGMHHPMWGMWGIWAIFMMLVMLAFWGVVIAAIVVAIRWLAGLRHSRPPDTALDILRQRYARGDITREEFEAKKRDLS